MYVQTDFKDDLDMIPHYFGDGSNGYDLEVTKLWLMKQY